MNSTEASRISLCDYFDEDLVIRIDKKGLRQLGLVIESSENASSDDDDDDDDTDSDRDDDGSNHKYGWKRIKPGYAKVAWYPNGETQLVNEKKVSLYDRSLLAGDVVQRLSDAKTPAPNREHGFCKSTHVVATVRILGTEKVVDGVSVDQLQLLSPISTDSVCLLDGWVGFIRDIKYCITLKCGDSSLLVVPDDDLVDFYDLLTQRNNESEFSKDDFYIGQQLYGPKSSLKHAIWLMQTPEMKAFMSSCSRATSKIKVAVEEVCIDSVSVNWMWCLSPDKMSVKNHSGNEEALNGSLNTKNSLKNIALDALKSATQVLQRKRSHENEFNTTPSDLITGDAIKRIKCLNYFEKSSLQIGDHCYYTINPSDNIINIEEWKKKETKLRCNDNSDEYDIVSGEELEEDAIIKNDLSSILANYDTNESFSASTSIGSSSSKDKKRRRKCKTKFTLSLKQVKMKKLRPAQRKASYIIPIEVVANNRYPIEIIATDTKVTVVWQNGLVEHDIPSTSLYPVHHIDSHDFYPGDFIAENRDNQDPFCYGVVQKVDFMSRVATVNWYKYSLDPHSPQLSHLSSQEDLSVYDIKDHADFNFRPGCCVVRFPKTGATDEDLQLRAGQIIDLDLDGKLICAWTNGEYSKAYPQELCIIGDYDSDDFWDDSDNEMDDPSVHYHSDSNNESWETDSDQTDVIDTHQNTFSHNKKNQINGEENQMESLEEHLFSVLERIENQIKRCFDGPLGVSNCESVLPGVKNMLESTLQRLMESKDPKDSGELAKLSESLDQFNHLSEFISNFSTLKTKYSEDKSISAFNSFCNASINGLNNGCFASDEPHVSEPPDSDKAEPDASGESVDPYNQLINTLKTIIAKFEDVTRSVVRTTQFEHEENGPVVVNGTNEPETSQRLNDEPNEKGSTLNESKGKMIQLDEVPECHKFIASTFQPKNAIEFMRRIKEEMTLLNSSLPEGIYVAAYDDRMDLYSVMITGPKSTPYEDGLFFFDIQLPSTYPHVPPLVHYISFCSDRLNPNLYENGKVCVSLLGTWSGKGTEVWSSITSNLLQVIISIQALILVAEPYYNEAGYQKQRGTALAHENSRLYNEMVAVKLVQSMTKIILCPPIQFKTIIEQHISSVGDKFINRNEYWLSISQYCNNNLLTSIEEVAKKPQFADNTLPQFPLLPGSHGFCLSLEKALQHFKETKNLLFRIT